MRHRFKKKKKIKGEEIKGNRNYQLKAAFFMDGAFELLEFNHKPIV